MLALLKQQNRFLLNYVRNGNLTEVNKLIAAGAVINYNENGTVLHLASQLGNNC